MKNVISISKMIRFYNFENSEYEEREIIRSYNSLATAYLIYPKVSVFLIKDINYLKRFTKKITNVDAGFTVGNKIYILDKANILSKTIWEKEDISRIYIHELSHVFNFSLNNLREPWWLEEGLASYFSKMYNTQFVKLFTDSNKEISFEYLYSKKEWEKNKGILKFYQSALFVEFLIKKYSIKKVLLLKRSLKKKDFFKLFKEILGNSFLDDFAEWKMILKKTKKSKIKEKWLRELIP